MREPQVVERTCVVRLVEINRHGELTGLRLPAGTYTLTKVEPGPTDEDFANAAWREHRASFKRLMPERYRLEVLREDGATSAGFGLTKWNPLKEAAA